MTAAKSTSQPSQTSTSALQVLAQSGVAATSAGPSMPSAQVPATPASLTLEQQHITAVEGIVPSLQNIIATVKLNCRLYLKTCALLSFFFFFLCYYFIHFFINLCFGLCYTIGISNKYIFDCTV